MFDRKEVAKRLKKLREEEESKRQDVIGSKYKLSYIKLSAEIFEKTQIVISHTALWDYENENKDKKMSIENLCALAAFYGVSLIIYLE
jgi:transcriptional regulator with XRE-family HTH domain